MEEYLKVRKEWQKSDTERDKDQKDPAGIRRYDNIQYGPDLEMNVLDLYLPEDYDRPLSVIISIHGGAYVYGTKEIYQFYGMNMATRGFAFVNFTYRLAPEHGFPAALEDTCLVMDWISENKDKYGLDINNAFLVGDSAGAHYASLYSAAYSNPKYADFIGLKINHDIRIRACALNCGLYDPLLLVKRDGLDNATEYLIGPDWKEKSPDYLCTANFLDPSYPPVYLMSGTNDFLLPQLEPFKKALKDHGIEVESKIYGGSDPEKAYHVFHVDMNNIFQKECNDDEADFFRKHVVR